MFSLGSKSNFSSAKNHQDAYLSRIYLHRDSPRQKLTPTWDRATSQTLSAYRCKKSNLRRFHRKAGRLASRCIGRIQNLDPICQQRVPVTQTQVEEAFYGCSCEYTAPNNKGERAFQRDKGQKEGNTWTFHYIQIELIRVVHHKSERIGVLTYTKVSLSC